MRYIFLLAIGLGFIISCQYGSYHNKKIDELSIQFMNELAERDYETPTSSHTPSVQKKVAISTKKIYSRIL